MKINSTTVNGFEIKGMAGYGASAWNVGSAPLKIVTRENRNRKSVIRLPREVRSENNAVHSSEARRYVGTELRMWGALDLAVGVMLIVCPLMMGF